MLFLSQLLKFKTAFGRLWLAGTVGVHKRPFSKDVILTCDVEELVDAIFNVDTPLSPRLSGTFLCGVCAIYNQKWNLFQAEVLALFRKLYSSPKPVSGENDESTEDSESSALIVKRKRHRTKKSILQHGEVNGHSDVSKRGRLSEYLQTWNSSLVETNVEDVFRQEEAELQNFRLILQQIETPANSKDDRQNLSARDGEPRQPINTSTSAQDNVFSIFSTNETLDFQCSAVEKEVAVTCGTKQLQVRADCQAGEGQTLWTEDELFADLATAQAACLNETGALIQQEVVTSCSFTPSCVVERSRSRRSTSPNYNSGHAHREATAIVARPCVESSVPTATSASLSVRAAVNKGENEENLDETSQESLSKRARFYAAATTMSIPARLDSYNTIVSDSELRRWRTPMAHCRPGKPGSHQLTVMNASDAALYHPYRLNLKKIITDEEKSKSLVISGRFPGTFPDYLGFGIFSFNSMSSKQPLWKQTLHSRSDRIPNGLKRKAWKKKSDGFSPAVKDARPLVQTAAVEVVPEETTTVGDLEQPRDPPGLQQDDKENVFPPRSLLQTPFPNSRIEKLRGIFNGSGFPSHTEQCMTEYGSSFRRVDSLGCSTDFMLAAPSRRFSLLSDCAQSGTLQKGGSDCCSVSRVGASVTSFYDPTEFEETNQSLDFQFTNRESIGTLSKALEKTPSGFSCSSNATLGNSFSLSETGFNDLCSKNYTGPESLPVETVTPTCTHDPSTLRQTTRIETTVTIETWYLRNYIQELFDLKRQEASSESPVYLTFQELAPPVFTDSLLASRALFHLLVLASSAELRLSSQRTANGDIIHIHETLESIETPPIRRPGKLNI